MGDGGGRGRGGVGIDVGVGGRSNVNDKLGVAEERRVQLRECRPLGETRAASTPAFAHPLCIEAIACVEFVAHDAPKHTHPTPSMTRCFNSAFITQLSATLTIPILTDITNLDDIPLDKRLPSSSPLAIFN